MTLKSFCGCGHPLSTHDLSAGRDSRCPHCGAPIGASEPVGVSPPAAAAPVGDAVPMSPMERLRLAQRERRAQLAQAREAEEVDEVRPASFRFVRFLSRRAPRDEALARLEPERHGYECLLYPFLAWRSWLAVAAILTLLSGALALLWPEVASRVPRDAATALLWALAGALGLLQFCLPCAYLESVLASAIEGEVAYIRWSGQPVRAILGAGLRWLACFLCGPIVFAGTAWLYWQGLDEATTLDYLVVVELASVAIAYELFAVVAVTMSGRLRDLHPLAVVDVVHWLGWRAPAVVLAVSLLLVGHQWLFQAAVEEVQLTEANLWGLLFFAWASGVYWSLFVCRLLGVWSYRRRRGLA